jgi:hypothetical protein
MNKVELNKMVKRLRKLEARATKGPWLQWTLAGDISSKPEDCLIMQTFWTEKDKNGCTRSTAQGDVDVQFVIAVRNHLIEILDALEESQGKN